VKLIAKLLAVLALLVVLAVGGMSLWMMTPYPQDQAPIDQALVSNERVKVTQREFLVFEPASGNADAGLIFYPGGKVDPVAYAPILRELANNGLMVVVTPMPLKAAFLGIERADEVIASMPGIDRWFLGGHSLGGVAASLYAEQSAAKLAGLVFWASYPVADLSRLDLEVLSIYASGDAQTTAEEIDQSRDLLPAGTRFVEIEGNHWQYGHFSKELHQRPPAVSRERQQDDIVAATLEFVAASGD
jgi:hypothetical protein